MTDMTPIIIVDDEAAIRDSLSFLLDMHGYAVTVFGSGDAFLAAGVKAVTCPVMMDVRMPGRDGLATLEEALAINPDLNVIIMSGHGDIPLAVRALKIGAMDFIEKPFQAADILPVLEKAVQPDAHAQPAVNPTGGGLEKLTPREIEIARLLTDGLANKAVAYELGISVRTVETHRARLLSKLGIRSLSDLVKLVLKAG